MANDGKTRVRCSCGQVHRLTPSAMAVVIEAFQSGELHTVMRVGEHTLVAPVCVLNALSTMDVEDVTKRYKGSIAWQT